MVVARRFSLWASHRHLGGEQDAWLGEPLVLSRSIFLIFTVTEWTKPISELYQYMCLTLNPSRPLQKF